MKICHVCDVTPWTCGLYETTRELAEAEIDLGHDARLVDTRKLTIPWQVETSPTGKSLMRFDVTAPDPPPKPGTRDRGVLVADESWMDEADVIQSHRGLARTEGEGHQPDVPTVHLIHGMPHYSFKLGEMGKGEIYMRNREIAHNPAYQTIVTMWDRYVPYWELVFGEGRVKYVPSWVDLKRFRPGDSGYDFMGLRAKVNVLVADFWREMIDPFHAMNAFALFAKTHPDVRMHVFGLDNRQHLRQGFFETLLDVGGTDTLPDRQALATDMLRARRADLPAIAKRFNAIQQKSGRGILGATAPIVSFMDQVYPACDVLLTSKNTESRVVKEAMACGCQVVGATGLPCTPYTADAEDIPAYATAIGRAVADIGPKAVQRNRKYAMDHYDVRESAKMMVNICKEARKTWLKGKKAEPKKKAG